MIFFFKYVVCPIWVFTGGSLGAPTLSPTSTTLKHLQLSFADGETSCRTHVLCCCPGKTSQHHGPQRGQKKSSIIAVESWHFASLCTPIHCFMLHWHIARFVSTINNICLIYGLLSLWCKIDFVLRGSAVYTGDCQVAKVSFLTVTLKPVQHQQPHSVNPWKTSVLHILPAVLNIFIMTLGLLSWDAALWWAS